MIREKTVNSGSMLVLYTLQRNHLWMDEWMEGWMDGHP
jgi:hypothetical protein